MSTRRIRAIFRKELREYSRHPTILLAVAIFFTHGLAFGLYGIMVASLEVGLFISAPVRRPLDLLRALALVAVQAIIPLIFFAWWIVLRPHEVRLGQPNVVRHEQRSGAHRDCPRGGVWRRRAGIVIEPSAFIRGDPPPCLPSRCPTVPCAVSMGQ